MLSLRKYSKQRDDLAKTSLPTMCINELFILHEPNRVDEIQFTSLTHIPRSTCLGTYNFLLFFKFLAINFFHMAHAFSSIIGLNVD